MCTFHKKKCQMQNPLSEFTEIHLNKFANLLTSVQLDCFGLIVYLIPLKYQFESD